MFRWVVMDRSNNIPVSGVMIREKAVQIAKDVVEQYKDKDEATKSKLHYANLKEFEDSSHWYTNFCRRFGIVSGTLSGALIDSCLSFSIFFVRLFL